MIRSRPDLVLGLCVFLYTLLYLPIYAGILIIFAICLAVVKRKTDWLDSGASTPNATGSSFRLKKQQQGRWRLPVVPPSPNISAGSSNTSLNHLHRIVTSTATNRHQQSFVSTSPPNQSLSPNQSPFGVGGVSHRHAVTGPRLAFECINYNNSHPMASRSGRLSPKFTSTPTSVATPCVLSSSRLSSTPPTSMDARCQGLSPRLREQCFSEKRLQFSSCSGESKSPYTTSVCQARYAGAGIYPVVNLSPIRPPLLSPGLGGGGATLVKNKMHYKLPHSEMLAAAKLRLGREIPTNSPQGTSNSAKMPAANTRSLKKRPSKDVTSANDAATKRQRADLPYLAEGVHLQAPVLSDGLIPYFDEQMMESASCLFSPRPIATTSTTTNARTVAPSGAAKSVTFKRGACSAIESSYSSSKRMLINNMTSVKRKCEEPLTSTSKRSYHVSLPEAPSLSPISPPPVPIRIATATESFQQDDVTTASPSGVVENSPRQSKSSSEETTSPEIVINLDLGSSDNLRRPLYVPTVADYMADRRTDEDRLKTILSFLSPLPKKDTAESKMGITSTSPVVSLNKLAQPFSLLPTPLATSPLSSSSLLLTSATATTSCADQPTRISFAALPATASATTTLASAPLSSANLLTTTSSSLLSTPATLNSTLLLAPALHTTSSSLLSTTLPPHVDLTSLQPTSSTLATQITTGNVTTTQDSQPTSSVAPVSATQSTSSLFSATTTAPAPSFAFGATPAPSSVVGGASFSFGAPQPPSTTTVASIKPTIFSFGGVATSSTAPISANPTISSSTGTTSMFSPGTGASTANTFTSIASGQPTSVATSIQPTGSFSVPNFASAFSSPSTTATPITTSSVMTPSFGGGSFVAPAFATTAATSLLPNPTVTGTTSGSHLGFNGTQNMLGQQNLTPAKSTTVFGSGTSFGANSLVQGGVNFASPMSGTFGNSGAAFAATTPTTSGFNYSNGSANSTAAAVVTSAPSMFGKTGTTFDMSKGGGNNPFGGATSQPSTTFGGGTSQPSTTFGGGGQFGSGSSAFGSGVTGNAFGATPGAQFGATTTTNSSTGFGAASSANNAGFGSSTVNFSSAGQQAATMTSAFGAGSMVNKMLTTQPAGQAMNGNSSAAFVFGSSVGSSQQQPAATSGGGAFNFGAQQTNGVGSTGGFQFGSAQQPTAPALAANNNNNFGGLGQSSQGFAFNPASPPSFNFGAGSNPVVANSPAMFSMGSGAAPSSRRQTRTLAGRSARHR